MTKLLIAIIIFSPLWIGVICSIVYLINRIKVAKDASQKR
jgi:type IV secretory pathway VirB3-like protein